MIFLILCVLILAFAYVKFYRPLVARQKETAAKLAALQKVTAAYDNAVMTLAQRQQWERDVRTAVAAITT